MTVNSTINRVTESGNGTKTAFDFAFKIFANDELKVYKVLDSTGAATLQTITTDYTVAFDSEAETGTVNFVVAPTALQSSLIIRELEIDQQTDLPTEDNFPETSIENALDKLTMICQELKETLDRSLTAPATSGLSLELPAPEAGKALVWNATEDAIENSEIDVGDFDAAVTAAQDAANLSLMYASNAEAAQEATVGFDHKGTWSGATTYADANIVTFTQTSGKIGTFISLQAGNLNKNPETETSYWTKLAEYVPDTSACKVLQAAANQDISTATATLVVLDSEEYDLNSEFDNTAGNYKYIAKQACKVLVTAYGKMGGGAFSGGEWVELMIYKNGTMVTKSRIIVPSPVDVCLSVSTVLSMNGTTDYIQLYIQHAAGATEALEEAELTVTNIIKV